GQLPARQRVGAAEPGPIRHHNPYPQMSDKPDQPLPHQPSVRGTNTVQHDRTRRAAVIGIRHRPAIRQPHLVSVTHATTGPSRRSAGEAPRRTPPSARVATGKRTPPRRPGGPTPRNNRHDQTLGSAADRALPSVTTSGPRRHLNNPLGQPGASR